MARISVIGAGYVGLTTAAGMAALGHNVVCADIDIEKVDNLNAGRIPIHELGMDKLVQEGLDTGHLRFVLGAANASDESEFHFLCLPTPPGEDGAADLSFVLAAVAEIGPTLPENSVVINKSTVPVGTSEKVATAIGRSDVAVVSNPEFLREGNAVGDFMSPDRIVVGSNNADAAERVAELYRRVDTHILRTDARSAELIKYASNAFLATKLTFVNEMAEVCEQLGADIDQVMSGMGYDRRIGTSYLSPGPGWGGSCFPKDTEALVHIAAQADCEFDFLRHVIKLNHRHLARVAAKVETLLGGSVEGRQIGAWGLTFKAGTDDLRESPALAVLGLLNEKGAQIKAFDPAVQATPAQLPDVEIAPDALAAADGVECLVVLTEWDAFTKVDLAQVHQAMKAPNVVDARNLLDREQLDTLGFAYTGIGK